MTERSTAEEFDRVFDAGGDVGAYVDWEHPVESPVLRRPEPVSVTFEVDPELVVAFDSGRHSNHILRASACGAGSILSLRMLWTNAGLPMSSAVCRCCEFQRISPGHRPTSMIGGLWCDGSFMQAQPRKACS